MDTIKSLYKEIFLTFYEINKCKILTKLKIETSELFLLSQFTRIKIN